MAVEGDRIELGQDRHAVDIRIDPVADRDVNQAVFSADWYGWFGAIAHQGIYTGSTPSS